MWGRGQRPPHISILHELQEYLIFQDSLTCTRIMFSLFRYTFSLSITSASDDVLMIRPTMYFFIPENKIYDSVKRGQNGSSICLREWHILELRVLAVPLVPLGTFTAVFNELC
jgi:hypothetical protein